MYHSISLGEKNTWDDWHLVPATRPVVNPPSVKSLVIDIPGSDGSIDLTESLTGDVAYGDRNGSWDFYVLHEYWHSWTETYNTVLNYLHGQKLKVILEDEPDYYYIGRLKVNKWNSNKDYSRITIDYTLEPYKYELFSSDEDWLWDPFNFLTGVIREWKDLQVNGNLELLAPGSRRTTVPSFRVESTNNEGMKIRTRRTEGETTLYSAWIDFPDGTNRNPSIVLKDGEQYLEFQGNGTVTVIYRGAIL